MALIFALDMKVDYLRKLIRVFQVANEVKIIAIQRHLKISNEEIEKIKQQLPELPQTKIKRYVEVYYLRPIDAYIITREKHNADLFESTRWHSWPGSGQPESRYQNAPPDSDFQSYLDQIRAELNQNGAILIANGVEIRKLYE